MQEINFNHIRPFHGGQREAFEELCCQIFRRLPQEKLSEGGLYERYRGAGGDGGVEAVWIFPNKEEWGLQAKYFGTMESSQFRQMEDSLEQAIKNHPNLSRYIFCLPFNPTGPATGGTRGKSQTEKLKEWKQEQLKELQKMDILLSIEFWTETELRDRLIEADPEGGMRRYWFDNELMTTNWTHERLTEAKEQAGKRYSPKLSVSVPAFEALEAFACSESWQREMKKLQDSFKNALKRWDYSKESIGDFSETVADKARRISNSLSFMGKQLTHVSQLDHNFHLDEMIECAKYMMNETSELENIFLEDLLQKHGKNADTPNFRQFNAEYMVSFPAEKLDTARDLLESLGTLDDWLKGTEAKLPRSQTMLLRGPAGIGKTHAIVDHALYRDVQNQICVIFFGEDFGQNEPWQTISNKLGLPGDISRDELWSMVNTAAESTGKPALIYIDALNESRERERWKQSWLSSLRQQISQFTWIKLCVSCRDTYLDEVMEEGEHWPTFEHNGFVGREFDAIRQFFEFYQLEPPATPLLQREFANPLFLHLVCQGLKGANLNSMPLGTVGFSDVLRLLLTEKNQRIARACHYDPREDKLGQAVMSLAQKIVKEKTRLLPLEVAKATVNSIHIVNDHERSLFFQLEKEGLVSLIAIKSRPLGPKTWFCRFTFERIADFLIALSMINELETGNDIVEEFENGNLSFGVLSEENINDSGLLEAWSIILPEKFGIELCEIDWGLDYHKYVLPIAFSGFQWRSLESFSFKTERMIRDGLANHDSSLTAMDAIIGVSHIPNHPYNAEFIERLLISEKMTERDPFWCAILHEDYKEQGATWRLIEWVLKANLSSFCEETLELWSLTLGWFCAASDRRIRDKATKGLVRLFISNASVIKQTLIRFLNVDDDYILERVSLASYSAVLRVNDSQVLQEVAHTVYNEVFSVDSIPLNALTRDWLRLILESADRQALTADYVNPEKFRPPYSSNWPTFPSDSEIQHLSDRDAFKDEMNLGEYNIGTDFARYILDPCLLRRFDLDSAGITEEDVYRWFIKGVSDLGYPGEHERCYHYDRYLVGQYGGGRGKPVWAERLGKKYYWILLYRLGGLFADHLPRMVDPWEERAETSLPELQGIEFRNIDASDLRMFSPQPLIDNEWWEPVTYDFSSMQFISNDKWVWSADFPNIMDSLVSVDPSGEEWIHLSLSCALEKTVGTNTDEKYPCRQFTNLFNAVTVPYTNLESIKKALRSEKISWNYEASDYRLQIGEYPNTLTFDQSVENGVLYLEGKIPGSENAEVTSIELLRGGELKYDCSANREDPNLRVPSPALIHFRELKWNGQNGWTDQNGKIQIQSMKSQRNTGLLVKRSYLSDYLMSRSQVMICFGCQEKLLITGGINKLGIHQVFSAFTFDGENSCLLNQHTPM